MIDHLIGLAGTAETKVNEGNIATALGSGTVEVLATPAMIALMEKAASELVQKHLPARMTTVGSLIEAQHLAATPIGMTVTARAELVEVNGRKLVFKVQAYDDKEKIGEGMHQRVIVDSNKFIDRANAKR